jgi:hypothetical protein
MKTKILTITAITLLNSMFITTGANKALAEPVISDIDQSPAIINKAKQEFNVRVRLTSPNPRSCQDLKVSLTSKEMGLTSARRPLFQYQGKILGLEQNDPPSSCLATFKVNRQHKDKAAFLMFEADRLFCMDSDKLTQDMNNQISVRVLAKSPDINLNCFSYTPRR